MTDLRKYKFLSRSSDPRPVLHSTNWYIYGIRNISGVVYNMMVIILDKSEDIYEYYPEAVDIEIVKTEVEEVKRGGPLNVVNHLRYFDYSALTENQKTASPTFLYVVSNLAGKNMSDSQIAKRLGVTTGAWKKLKQREDVAMALNGGYEEYLSNIKL